MKIAVAVLGTGLVAAHLPALAQVASAPESASMRLRDRDIYGHQLMTPAERDAFRQQMRHARTQEERDRLRAEHHDQMKARAKERGITLPEMPPAGRGPGMGGGPRGG
ncbi:MAG TPA: hypothetical protein VIP05_18260 [Burkholderiaceae bacterium]